MKKIIWVVLPLIIALVFSFYKYIELSDKATPVRNVSYNFESSSIELSESKHNKETFQLDVLVGYGNPQMFSKDFNHNNRFATTTILENIPQIYLFDFENKTRVEIDTSFYEKIKNEFNEGAISYGFFWHPQEDILMVSLGGMYYPTKLYLFNLDDTKTKLQFIKEITFNNAEDLQIFDWINTSDGNADGFVVRVITNKENDSSNGATIITDSYFEVIEKDGSIRSDKIY